MTAITDRANTAFRDMESPGSSVPNEPEKLVIRQLFAVIDIALSSLGVNGAITVKKATKALLDVDLAHDEDTLAVVYDDTTAANNGIYAKVGGSGAGSWSLTDLALPSSFADDLAEVLASSDAAQAALADALAIYGSISELDAAVAAGVAAVAPAEAARDAAIVAQDLSEDARDISVTAKTDAESAAALAVAAAEASGDVTFFDTKAAAVAALGGLAEGAVVEVFADEDEDANRTRYRVESAALVLKANLSSADYVSFLPAAIGAVNEPASTALERMGVFPEQFSTSGFNGIDPDTVPFDAAVDAVLALHTANPTYSLKAVLSADPNSIVYLPGGGSAFGVGRIDFPGVVSMAVAADYLEVGLNSVLGDPSRYDIAKISTGYLRVVGVMNGQVNIGQAPKVEWWADSSVAGKKSNAYNYAWYGDVTTIEINGIDSDGVGGSAPYINSNRHHTQRLRILTIKAGYPHNMNFFDGMGSDSLALNIEAGYSNFVEDGRLEVASTLTFAAGTHNNYVVSAYYGFADSYFRRVAYGLHTVANAGKSNELFEKLDAYFDQKELWAVHANSKNYDVARFTRGAASLICVSNNQVIFDSGIFPLSNALGIYVEADADVSQFLTPFVYFYDAAGALITTDPGSDIISLVNGSWQTTGDPLGLNYHYRTSAPVENTTVSLFPKSGSGVAFCRLVLRTGGAVNGTAFRSLRVVLTEAKKYNTKMPMLRPGVRDAYFSTVTQTATAVPCTSGLFTAGETVLAANVPGTAAPELGSVTTPPSKYVIRAWDRMTTGSGHVLNTDWRQRRDLTGN